MQSFTVYSILISVKRNIIMAQNHQTILKNKETKEVYRTWKNKKQNPDKMTLMKYSKKLNKRVPFTEVKK